MRLSTPEPGQQVEAACPPSALAERSIARRTLDAMADAVITTDLAGTIDYFNPAAEQLTGWPASIAVGRRLDALLPFVSEATRSPITNSIRGCLESGGPFNLGGGLLLCRDGGEVPIGISIAPVRDSIGAAAVAVVLVIRNEAEQRRTGRRLPRRAG